jgi:hypothetical protein
MAGGDSRSDRQVLREKWSRWTGIVALFARRRLARRRVDPGAYAALRNDLIAACRSLAESDEERRPYYNSLEDLIRPWLSPRVLARADGEILSTLLQRCRAAQRELSGRRWMPGWPIELGPGAMIIAGAVLFGAASVFLEFGRPAIVFVRDAADTAWLIIKYASDFQKQSAVAVLVVAGAIYTISRSVRLWS